MEFEHITNDGAVETYDSASGVFAALLNEVRELSKKKPDATLSKSKVNLINNVLTDLLGVVKGEPAAKYLRLLADEDLPQVSDALMMMVQFEAALKAFRNRYSQYVRLNGSLYTKWITAENLEQWEQAGIRVTSK